jgi:geranylgeranyl reductase family protein
LYDAAIIGGGPAGSYTAGRLAGQGHQVIVLERKQRAGEAAACTGIISQECALLFDIDERTILRQASSARLYSPSGNELHVRREEPQACILDRAAFDISMAERARAAGAEYRFGSPVKDIAVSNDDVTVKLHGRGEAEAIRARAAVIATGFGSGLGARLGLGRPGDFTVGAQIDVTAPDTEEVEVYFGDMAPGFFAWLVPTAPPLARAGLMSRRSPRLYLEKWLERLRAEGKITSTCGEIICGGIPLKPPPRTYCERIMAVGDAAGQVKPTSGGGIYYGLLGAEAAAKTLHGALEEDDLSAKRLSRYERAWRRKLGRELRTGYWARKLFERLSDRQLDRLFATIRANGIDEALLRAEDVSFDWHGRTVSKLLKYSIVSRTIGRLKLPMTGRAD